MNNTTIIETLMCIIIGGLIAIGIYLAICRDVDAVTPPKYAFKDVPWSASAAHRSNFQAKPELLA